MLCECYLTSLSPGHPFLLDALSLTPSLSNTPLQIHTHTHIDTTPLLRQQVKQNNSLCHTIAPLPRSRHWLLYSMTFFPPSPPPLSSLLCSLLVLIGSVFFSYHRNSTKTRASDGELLDLSRCAAVLCCVVCVDLVQPPYIKRGFVILNTFVWWELEVLCVCACYKPSYQRFVSVRFTKATFKFAAMKI